MLVLGSTSGSTNVNETRREELEMLIDELVELNGEELVQSEMKETPLLAISLVEGLLQASLLVYR